ncbi:hypothetical protein [Novosphingopyxis sp.]|uniref:hypothetical protein n=1 Tax=Novosphingopyxis sp. TaxID=2709690 RepID=UPI003B5C25D2
MPDLDRSVWTQTVGIDARGRVSLPPPVRQRLAWTNAAGIYLARLHGNGAVEVVTWAGNGERIRTALRERYDALPKHQRADFALAAMDRFQKFRGEKGGRLTLPAIVRSQIDPKGLQFVRIVVRDGSFHLWNDEAWKAGRVKRIALLEREGIL